MDLHDVIISVLNQSNRALTCREIAERVNNSGLYTNRPDVPPSQISARINRKTYSHLFIKDKSVTPMLISLSD